MTAKKKTVAKKKVTKKVKDDFECAGPVAVRGGGAGSISGNVGGGGGPSFSQAVQNNIETSRTTRLNYWPLIIGITLLALVLLLGQ